MGLLLLPSAEAFALIWRPAASVFGALLFCFLLTMNGKPLRMNSPESWVTLVSTPELINDIRTATNDQLSLHAAAKEHLPQLTPGVRVIIDRTFAQELRTGRSVNVLALCKKVVTKVSAYAFFGLDYVEDNEFLNAAYYYNEDVLYGSELLRITPKFLVPLVGMFIPLFLKRQRTFFYGLVAIIEDRMNNPDPLTKYNDVIQWIIDTSPKSKPWTPGRMAFEVMAIWFGSVQGLATTLTFAIYSLCENSEYISPLRTEIESSAGGEFFVKGEGLPLMDSFLKECSRWTPVESDPKRLGRESSIQPEGPSKFTDVSETWHVWGTGKLTCPGRFFVSYAMKHVMCHILENYDPEMVEAHGKHTINWRTLTLPGLGVKANFKARV
ncbi:hypothetical protein DL765_008062 [Monosporascus sp. GIB2]|nr:hypothetical protein DL765_008062 [Monosporascus sp. GIB2]